MTVLPMRLTRPAAPVHYGALPCEHCHVTYRTAHTSVCPCRQELARPAEARVFAGLLNALPLGIALWLIAAALLIWSLM